MSEVSNTPTKPHDPDWRMKAISEGYAELFRAAEYVRDARAIEHVDDAHLENALNGLEKALSELEAVL